MVESDWRYLIGLIWSLLSRGVQGLLIRIQYLRRLVIDSFAFKSWPVFCHN